MAGEGDAYGVRRRETGAGSEIEVLLEDVRVRGFAVAPSVLAASRVEALNDAMDRIYRSQCAEVGGDEALASINDADIARCLLAYDDLFVELAAHPLMLDLARDLLGENVVLLMQNGVINRPDRKQFQTHWHRDLNYQHWVCSKPLAISVLVSLETFSPETGGTLFLPGSHRLEDFPSKRIVERDAVAPPAPPGSFLIFDSMLFHRAGLNTSSRIRRAVNHVIGAPILAQQVDIPAMLNRAAPSDPWLAGYLGYRWNPVKDVAAWRRRKISA